MEDQQCPRCKTTKYRNPALKLMVNVCGHSLCDSCIELLFIRGSGACPECGVPLRRSNFRLQLFEDTYVEKEVDIRKRVLKDFNMKEEDFKTLHEYNDYLEQIETIAVINSHQRFGFSSMYFPPVIPRITLASLVNMMRYLRVYNLSNNIDVDSTKKTIEQYRKTNKDTILKNKSKLSKDEEYIAMLIEQEQQSALLHKTQSRDEELKEKLNKLKNKQALIDELMFSEGDATDILARHKATVSAEEEGPYKKTVFTAERTTTSDYIPMQLDDSPAYEYSEIMFETYGPDTPITKDIIDKGYVANVRRANSQELAGGYQSFYGCQRALMDAFNGLMFHVEPPPSIEDPV